MTILTVGTGSGYQYSTLAAAVAASQNGDTIEVQPGTYTNDFSTINTNITIEGKDGIAHFVATVPPSNLKGILTIDADVTLINLELSGAAIPSDDGGNGAGIRFETGSLTLQNVYIHDNQDGLLANAASTANITINDSEFANNGVSDPSSSGYGYTHNIYVGAINTLTITNSYITGANVGHEIKSRAATTVIENNRISEGPNGTGSYDIDLPNGGAATIQNNYIEKGPNSGNPTLISFGEEGANANSSLTVSGNTIVNDLGSSALVVNNRSSATVSITNNTTYGLTQSQIASGASTQSGNTYAPQSSEPAANTSAPYLPPYDTGCFVAGTHIATPGGAVPVEDLRVGDPVSTHAGGTVQVTWIGRRLVDCARHPAPHKVWPVRVCAGAFARGIPSRDLFVSPDHAVLVGDVLIPIGRLINGSTIAQVAVADVVYYHVELPHHDVLLAEDLPAESFLNTGDLSAFENGGGPVALYPDFSARLWDAMACAPMVLTGPALEDARARLAARAAELAGLRIAS